MLSELKKLNKSTHGDDRQNPEASGQSLERLLSGRPASEQQVLKKSASWAMNAHHDQQRASGEPYHSHLYAVAGILCPSTCTS